VTASARIADDLTPAARLAGRAALRRSAPVRAAIFWPILQAFLPLLIQIILELLQARHPATYGSGLATDEDARREWVMGRMPEVRAALGAGDEFDTPPWSEP
jgi:hypothetical protein